MKLTVVLMFAGNAILDARDARRILVTVCRVRLGIICTRIIALLLVKMDIMRKLIRENVLCVMRLV